MTIRELTAEERDAQKLARLEASIRQRAESISAKAERFGLTEEQRDRLVADQSVVVETRDQFTRVEEPYGFVELADCKFEIYVAERWDRQRGEFVSAEVYSKVTGTVVASSWVGAFCCGVAVSAPREVKAKGEQHSVHYVSLEKFREGYERSCSCG